MDSDSDEALDMVRSLVAQCSDVSPKATVQWCELCDERINGDQVEYTYLFDDSLAQPMLVCVEKPHEYVRQR